MSKPSESPGFHTREEIYSEPQCWAQCVDRLVSDEQASRILKEAPLHKLWLFVGCGSSYYIALAAAASWTALTGYPARAIPASELLLFPDLVESSLADFQPVLISRSGHTSEVLQAGEVLKQKRIPLVAITCAPDQALERLATWTIVLPFADEESTVMTRSFTSMLLAVQFLAAKAARNAAFLQSLRQVPQSAQKALDRMIPVIEDLVENNRFADYVCLGQGPYYGLACEAALKVQEMSCSYSQAFHTMEFRHGPKAIVARDTLIVFLLSQNGYSAECEVLEEVKSLGGTTLAVVPRADEPARQASDYLIELGATENEYRGLVTRALPGQLLGLLTGLKKGLDPDNPRHLSRVVTLNSAR